MKINIKKVTFDMEEIILETSYNCIFHVNKTKSGYKLTIIRTNEREKLC